MAPQNQKTQNDKMKQKSLMSWFSKPAANAKPSPSTPSASASKPVAQSNGNKRVEDVPRSSSPPSTPRNGSSDEVTACMVTPGMAMSSDGEGGASARDTPPTSDPIDVDMSSDEEGKAGATKTTLTKRKIMLEDSDKEEPESQRTELSASAGIATRAKRQRLALDLSDDEDTEEEVKAASFSKRLTNFRKSPAKPKARKSAPSDDDDFVVPDDEGDDSDDFTSLSSRSRGRSSSRSSASRIVSEDEYDDEDTPAKAKKPAKSSKAALTKKLKSSSGQEEISMNSFLTAAEQRLATQKKDKQSSDEPFSFLVDPKDKNGKRPGEPNYDARTIFIPKNAWKEFTPFEKQFWEIKQNHYDTVLFFQKGKFYELYEEDARVGHREFDLKLTSRVKMCMVGVPEMSFQFWAAKFLAKGYKVGRVDQAETALGAEMRKSKGKASEVKAKDNIVRRELNKVYTNGTLVDEELLSDEQAGHCISIREEWDEGDDVTSSLGICVLDSATSEFNISSFDDDVCRTKLETMIRQLRPKELIFTKGKLSVPTMRLLKVIIPGSCLWTTLREVEGFDYEETLKELKALYSSDSDEMDDDDNNGIPGAIRNMLGSKNAIEATGSMIWYLRQLNIDKGILSMKNFNIYDPMKKGQGLVLDGQTLAHIEIFMNSEGTEEGSLLKLLNRCVTPFGKRLFRIWLCMPLREVADINARLDAVQDLIDHPTFEGDFTEVAKGLPDLERIVSRIHANNCKIRDFLKVLSSFKKLSKSLSAFADTAESFESKTISGLLRSAPDLFPNVRRIEAMFQKPDKDSDVLLPEEGKDTAYDEVMTEIRELESTLDSELTKLEKKLGIKVEYWHSATGTKDIYLVQTSSREKRVPKDWIKNNSTKNYNRYTVPSLQATIRGLKEAREIRNAAIKEFRCRLFAEFDADRAVWLRAVRVFAELDCLLSLSKSSCALGEPVCRPEFVEGDAAWIDFEELRHPALCAVTKDDFIPNDVKLGGDVGRIALLTGPNMGGKSTAMRMTAVGVIMAQLGMMVPASKARICPVDAILTRMGAYDNMFSNASTFKVELDECSKILRDATPKSLVILDELGRGTSTYDGMAIAGAVLHQLATRTLPLSFFATHYGSLTDDFAYHPNIRNMHMETLVDDEKRELIFLYKLVEGVASSSFGTHVANLAGVPMDVVKRAGEVSDDFARQFKLKVEGKKQKTRLPLVAQADFVYLFQLATGMRNLPDDEVRRRETLRIIQRAAQKYV